VLILVVGSASAEEVVHFKSGSSLPIVSHKIEGNMIHVDLGDNAFMAFPMSVVERVEQASRNIIIGRSTGGGTNVMSARPDSAGSFQEQAALPSTQADGSRLGEKEMQEDEREYDSAIDVVNGVAVYRPVAGSGNPAKADTAVTGHARVRENRGTPGALNGARQVGTNQVIGAPRSRRASSTTSPVITGIEFRGKSVAEPPPPPPAPGDETQDGGAGDSSSD